MAHGLADQHFTSYEEAKNWVDSWIASKDQEFLRCGMRMLPERWSTVVADRCPRRQFQTYIANKAN